MKKLVEFTPPPEGGWAPRVHKPPTPPPEPAPEPVCEPEPESESESESSEEESGEYHDALAHPYVYGAGYNPYYNPYMMPFMPQTSMMYGMPGVMPGAMSGAMPGAMSGAMPAMPAAGQGAAMGDLLDIPVCGDGRRLSAAVPDSRRMSGVMPDGRRMSVPSYAAMPGMMGMGMMGGMPGMPPMAGMPPTGMLGVPGMDPRMSMGGMGGMPGIPQVPMVTPKRKKKAKGRKVKLADLLDENVEEERDLMVMSPPKYEHHFGLEEGGLVDLHFRPTAEMVDTGTENMIYGKPFAPIAQQIITSPRAPRTPKSPVHVPFVSTSPPIQRQRGFNIPELPPEYPPEQAAPVCSPTRPSSPARPASPAPPARPKPPAKKKAPPAKKKDDAGAAPAAAASGRPNLAEIRRLKKAAMAAGAPECDVIFAEPAVRETPAAALAAASPAPAAEERPGKKAKVPGPHTGKPSLAELRKQRRAMVKDQTDDFEIVIAGAEPPCEQPLVEVCEVAEVVEVAEPEPEPDANWSAGKAQAWLQEQLQRQPENKEEQLQRAQQELENLFGGQCFGSEEEVQEQLANLSAGAQLALHRQQNEEFLKQMELKKMEMKMLNKQELEGFANVWGPIDRRDPAEVEKELERLGRFELEPERAAQAARCAAEEAARQAAYMEDVLIQIDQSRREAEMDEALEGGEGNLISIEGDQVVCDMEGSPAHLPAIDLLGDDIAGVRFAEKFAIDDGQDPGCVLDIDPEEVEEYVQTNIKALKVVFDEVFAAFTFDSTETVKKVKIKYDMIATLAESLMNTIRQNNQVQESYPVLAEKIHGILKLSDRFMNKCSQYVPIVSLQNQEYDRYLTDFISKMQETINRASKNPVVNGGLNPHQLLLRRNLPTLLRLIEEQEDYLNTEEGIILSIFDQEEGWGLARQMREIVEMVNKPQEYRRFVETDMQMLRNLGSQLDQMIMDMNMIDTKMANKMMAVAEQDRRATAEALEQLRQEAANALRSVEDEANTRNIEMTKEQRRAARRLENLRVRFADEDQIFGEEGMQHRKKNRDRGPRGRYIHKQTVKAKKPMSFKEIREKQTTAIKEHDQKKAQKPKFITKTERPVIRRFTSAEKIPPSGMTPPKKQMVSTPKGKKAPPPKFTPGSGQKTCPVTPQEVAPPVEEEAPPLEPQPPTPVQMRACGRPKLPSPPKRPVFVMPEIVIPPPQAATTTPAPAPSGAASAKKKPASQARQAPGAQQAAPQQQQPQSPQPRTSETGARAAQRQSLHERLGGKALEDIEVEVDVTTSRRGGGAAFTLGGDNLEILEEQIREVERKKEASRRKPSQFLRRNTGKPCYTRARPPTQT